MPIALFYANVKTLNLKSNQITAEGARAIAESKSFPKLEQLIMKFNRIGEEGAKYLAAIRESRTVDHARSFSQPYW